MVPFYIDLRPETGLRGFFCGSNEKKPSPKQIEQNILSDKMLIYINIHKNIMLKCVCSCPVRVLKTVSNF